MTGCHAYLLFWGLFLRVILHIRAMVQSPFKLDGACLICLAFLMVQKPPVRSPQRPADRTGGLLLRETAQCPEEDEKVGHGSLTESETI